MPGENYAGLTFRHAVVGRSIGHVRGGPPPSGEGVSSGGRAVEHAAGLDHDGGRRDGGGDDGGSLSAACPLLSALRSDADVMPCFLRWLDADADGLVSCKDFETAVTRSPAEAAKAAVELEKRWSGVG